MCVCDLKSIFHSINKTHSDRHILAKVLWHTQQSPEQGGVAPAHKMDRQSWGSVPAGFCSLLEELQL